MKKENKTNRLFLILLIAGSLFLSIWGIKSYYSIHQAQKKLFFLPGKISARKTRPGQERRSNI
jgi:cell division protein FtsL